MEPSMASLASFRSPLLLFIHPPAPFYALSYPFLCLSPLTHCRSVSSPFLVLLVLFVLLVLIVPSKDAPPIVFVSN